ncbi:nucleotidyl transferase AbiEii/AbiGii toxin family protein [Candidatus Mycolicibacterium alkanivorans]|uniref:Nucleotidyl transferase AbiEii/AbiGii toxin family protein n=1 Tax=Candidatus Mycolicibacterium alkanivorans TaxID=2954114 RepID=A0ABS9YWI8_9MYCO|nr:nucleotidyl transferase AbiEii/AbiGii toxin family protein [Candidatus Mycolicibacterium alkanivorans]MCI4675612.1 nucleotidyl transferase AbiEii/AbiGii toxin family protein [Candidatus Mycolicibacterium alkanivorans]
MNQPYSSPPTNLRSLRDRLTQAAQRQGVVFGRLQRHVAMIVVAQFAAMLTDDNGAPLLLVKGGSSLELRRGIPDSRTSKDFDTVARRDIEEVHEQLAEAGETGWEGFTAIFTVPEEIDVPGMPVKPRRFTAKLNYRGKPFASVPIEVSTVEAGNADQFDTLTSDALGLVGVPVAVSVPCMTIPWQVAQKLHAVTAVFEAPRVNDRAHDLVDLQLLEGLLPDTDLSPTRSACIAVFEVRAQHPWPPNVTALPHWPPIYSGALEGLDHLELAATAEEAAGAVHRFVHRIDRATKT